MMGIVEIDGFVVVGMVVRTTNAEEINPSTAKIGKLWEDFYQNAAPLLNQEAQVYGLYTNYESDVTGAFDVVACSNGLSAELLENAMEFCVPSGTYLKFSGKGPMPQTVINLWGEVWRYFDADDCPHSRAYTTDFERFINGDEVEIMIAIK